MRSLPSGWNTVLAKLGFTRRKWNKRGRTNPFVRSLGMESLEDRRLLAAVTVSNNSDIVDGNVASIAALIASPGTDGGISLREAIMAANADTVADTITFAGSLNDAEILLDLAKGELEITNSLTIDATSPRSSIGRSVF